MFKSALERKDWLKYLLLVFVLAFVVRGCLGIGLQYVLNERNQFDLISGDAEGYWDLSTDIANGRDYAVHTPPRRIMRMPGFPVVLAMPQFLFGENMWVIRIWLALIAAATSTLVVALSLKLLNFRASCMVGIITVFTPLHAGFSVLILSETVFALCLLAGMYCGFKSHEAKEPSATPRDESGGDNRNTANSQYWWKIGFGVTQGLAIMMKPSWVFGPFCLIILLFCLDRARFLQYLSTGLLTLGVILLMLTPWIIRNASVSGKFVPATLWGGPSLYDGLNNRATGASDMWFIDEDKPFNTMTEYEVDKHYQKRAIRFVRENPGKTISLACVKFWRYIKPWPSANEINHWWGKLAMVSSTLLILTGAVWGSWLLRNSWSTETYVLIWFPFFYFAAIHMLFVSSVRYRIPADYLLMIPTGVMLNEWVNSLLLHRVSKP